MSNEIKIIGSPPNPGMPEELLGDFNVEEIKERAIELYNSEIETWDQYHELENYVCALEPHLEKMEFKTFKNRLLNIILDFYYQGDEYKQELEQEIAERGEVKPAVPSESEQNDNEASRILKTNNGLEKKEDDILY